MSDSDGQSHGEADAVPQGMPPPAVPPPTAHEPAAVPPATPPSGASGAGASLEASAIVCPRCGTRVAPGQKFCNSCGLELASQYQLPTHAEWLSRRVHGSTPAEVPPYENAAVSRAALRRARPEVTAYGLALRPEVRGNLLGAAALILSGAAFLAAVGSLLFLIEALQQHELTGLSVAQAFDLGSSLVLTGAFAVASLAFLGSARAQNGRLRTAALIATSGFVAEVVSYTVTAIVDGAHSANSNLVASYSAWSAAEIALGVAAGVVALAFLSPNAGRGKRNRRLGEASVSLSVGFVLLMVGSILTLIAY
jgi:hypothetical protein